MVWLHVQVDPVDATHLFSILAVPGVGSHKVRLAVMRASIIFLLLSTVTFADVGAPDPVNLPKEAIRALARLRVGMIRSEVEMIASKDGGINTLWRRERYWIPGHMVDGKYLMIHLDFKPASVADAVYNDQPQFDQWRLTHRKEARGDRSQDILMAVSQPFLVEPSDWVPRGYRPR